jgi:hypothetical protein
MRSRPRAPPAALDALEADASVRGVIIASGLKKDIFTAGCAPAPAGAPAEVAACMLTVCALVRRARSNDIQELYSKATTKERYTRFWHAQTRCLVRARLLLPCRTEGSARCVADTQRRRGRRRGCWRHRWSRSRRCAGIAPRAAACLRCAATRG